jgi:hypothetical protein
MALADRLAAFDWPALSSSLSSRGYARTPRVLDRAQCKALGDLYADETRFRSRVDMAQHRFGLGEYKYFADPIPELVRELREDLFPPLAAIANQWMTALGSPERFPATLAAFHTRCAEKGQTKPTPLLLRYEADGYNCLHQDIYGDVAFPLQVVVFLGSPGEDYTGGEFVLVEQRPRAQSAVEVIAGQQGEAVIFTTRIRPVSGSRGYYRVNVRHGVSPVHSGVRYTLGVIFHNAK